jgi:hypothetical protein
MRVLGYGNFVVVPRTEVENLEAIVATMPTWPDPDSVRLVGETTLVKLGP